MRQPDEVERLLQEARRRIADALHDGPIQGLTAAAFSLDLLANRIARGDRDVEPLVRQTRDQLAAEMQSLRQLMTELRVDGRGG